MGLGTPIRVVIADDEPITKMDLNELLSEVLIARLPLRRGRNRQMLICRAELHLNDALVLHSYQAVLTHVFGEGCRIVPRIMWRGGAR